ncbi:MAG: HAD-IA family hydrolase [Planctomycetota bacterium]
MTPIDADRVRVVCLDWGGVLLRICRGWEEGCAAAGIEVRGGSADDHLRAQRHALALRYHAGELSCGDFFARVAEATPGYDASEITRIHDAWLLGEYDGARALVEDLRAAPGITTALLSNTNHRHWARRDEFAAAGMLRHQVASHLLGVAKPDEAIYRALERTTDASGDQIAFFDDTAENVDAARALGWQAVHVDHAGDPPAQIRAALAGLLT